MTTNEDTAELYSVEIPLRLYFKTEEPVAIKDIATSLLALEKLTKRFPEMLEQLSEVKVHGYELRVERIESGSLLDDLCMKVFFDDPEKLEKFKNFLETSPMGTAVKVGIGGIMALLLISNMMMVYNNFAGEDAPSIEANHNTIINVGAESLGIAPDAVNELIKTGTSGSQNRMFRAARDVLRPVEGHAEASLEVPGVDPQRFSIPREAMAEVPFDADLNAEEHDIDYENVMLQIRALDRDKTDAGWWGVMPSVVGDKRLRLYFDDDVDADAIAFRPEVQVDATVTYRNDINHSTMVPKHITISHIYPAQRQ